MSNEGSSLSDPREQSDNQRRRAKAAPARSWRRIQRTLIAATGVVLASLAFGAASASPAGAVARPVSPGTSFMFSDSTGSATAPITSYRLTYANGNSCQPLQVTETGFNASWPQVESDVSTTNPVTKARLTTQAGKTLQNYTFGSPMTLLTATQSGTGGNETLTFTMKFNSVTIKTSKGTTTIDCFAP